MKTVMNSVALNSFRIASGYLRSFDGCHVTGPLRMLVFQQQYMQQAEGGSKASSGSENTSTSNDTGASDGQAERKQPKKSRTGGEMTDEGQVHTPSLGRTLSTRDIIQSKGKEAEERLRQKSQE